MLMFNQKLSLVPSLMVSPQLLPRLIQRASLITALPRRSLPARSLLALKCAVAHRLAMTQTFPVAKCVTRVAVDLSGDTALMGTKTGDLSLYSIAAQQDATLSLLRMYQIRLLSEISSVRFGPKRAPHLACATLFGSTLPGELAVYDARTMRCVDSTVLRRGSMWTAEWHKDAATIALGVSGGGLLVDLQYKKIFAVTTAKSDVIALKFTADGHVLLNGCRDGGIRSADCRINPVRSAYPFMRLKMSINCLQLLRDENYLMASSTGGELVLFDRRVHKVVTSFEDNVNTNLSTLEFAMDPHEQMVLSGGTDGVVRVWSATGGKPLHTVSAKEDEVPIHSVVWRECWGGGASRGALLNGSVVKFMSYK